MSNVLALKDYFAPASSFGAADEAVKFNETDGTIEVFNPDGSVTIDFNPKTGPLDGDHYSNIAEQLDDGELHAIAADLLDGIEADDRSRAEWIQTRARGIDLLGLKLETPRADIGTSSAPLEGMSTVRHPLLLEACLRFQANARGELLPSDGPVKVKNNGAGTADGDVLAEELEQEMNHFLTVTATEYVPDTDKMLFMTGFSGQTFKKVYHCPLRRRPCSESVDAKDLIVSNDATDIDNAGRVTQVIMMQRSVMKRMQYVGAYRRTELDEPTQNPTRLDTKMKSVDGITPTTERPQDAAHKLYECYADLEIPGQEHRDEDGEKTGLPLPYKVTIDVTSRKILEIRRNWKADDEDCKKRKVFVPYSFVPAFGFYAIGLLNILGNATNAVTAAWREMLDAGMFANFPGFLVAKTGANKQNNSTFRIAPGTGAQVDVQAGGKLSDNIMALPYKGPDAATMTLVDNIVQTGQRVGGTAELPVGEGRQDAPVGTTIALMEQAAKVLDAVHKRLHTAQGEEFKLLRELLCEDPDALVRTAKNKEKWNAQTILAALEDYELTPRADPNTPSHMHRIMKAMALKQIQQGNPGMDANAVDKRILRMLHIDDVDSLFLPPMPAEAPANDAAIIAQATVQGKQIDAASREKIATINAMTKGVELLAKEEADQRAAAVKILDIQTRSEQTEADRDSRDNFEIIKTAERVAMKQHDTRAKEKLANMKVNGNV